MQIFHRAKRTFPILLPIPDAGYALSQTHGAGIGGRGDLAVVEDAATSFHGVVDFSTGRGLEVGWVVGYVVEGFHAGGEGCEGGFGCHCGLGWLGRSDLVDLGEGVCFVLRFDAVL